MLTVLRTQPRLLLLVAVLVPLSLLAGGLDWPQEWIFFNAIAAILPLAILLSTATERLAEGLGASIGALLNAVFGTGFATGLRADLCSTLLLRLDTGAWSSRRRR